MKLGNLSREKILKYVVVALMLLSTVTFMAVAVMSGDAFALQGSNSYTIYSITDGWSKAALNNLAVKMGYGSLDSLVEINNLQPRNAASLLGTSSSNDLASNEYNVVVGDYSFTPVYLSLDTSGNKILTLWSNQSVRNVKYSKVAEPNNTKSNAYDSSYIRTAALNNSGTYYESFEEDGAVSYEQTSVHNLYLFTHGDVSKCIVAPQNMSWMSSENNYLNDIAFNQTGYGNAWKEDKVWLPSFYEIGSFWNTTLNQRRDVNAYWTRSALPSTSMMSQGTEYAYTINLDGQEYNQENVTNEKGLRFAINLNLSVLSYSLKDTTGYQRTTTADLDFYALQQAWIEAVDNSGNNTYRWTKENPKVFISKTGNKVAEVYWSTDYDKMSVNPNASITDTGVSNSVQIHGSIVFKLYADWGAKIRFESSTKDILLSGTKYTSAFMDEVCSIYSLDTDTSSRIEAYYTSFGGGAYSIETKAYLHKPSNGPKSATINRGNGTTISSVNLSGYAAAPGGNNKYFMGGALYVHPGCMMTIDLNGHTINRNLFEDSLVDDAAETGVYFGSSETTNMHVFTLDGTTTFTRATGSVGYGCVINNYRGDLTIDDTSIETKYLNYDANGLTNIGRITGGLASYEMGQWAYDPNYGGGIRVCGASGRLETQGTQDRTATYETYHEKECYLNILNGAVCYNASHAYGGIQTGYCNVYMKDGIICHNFARASSESYGGGGMGQNDIPSNYKLHGGIMAYNHTRGGGGAIYTDGDNNVHDAVLIMEFKNMLFEHNDAEIGGVICGENLNYQRKDWNFINCTVRNNSASTGGGAVAPIFSGQWAWDVVIDGGEWTNNQAATVGGLVYIISQADVTIKGGAVIKNNKAYGESTTTTGEVETTTPLGKGGVIYNQGGDVVLENVLIEDNEARLDGGAIYLEKGNISIKNGIFRNNKAGGSGGFIYQLAGNTVMDGNSVVENCSAALNGGGIDIESGEFIMKSGEVIGCSTTTPSADPASGGTVYGGAGLYLRQGKFFMASGKFNNNVSAGTGGGVYVAPDAVGATEDKKSKMYLIQGTLAGYNQPIEFIGNTAAYYPGFYCKSVYMQGEIYVENNKKVDLDRNIYLSEEEDIIYATGALSGYIGITKSITVGNQTTVVQPSKKKIVLDQEEYDDVRTSTAAEYKDNPLHNIKVKTFIDDSKNNVTAYAMTTKDLLCFHSDVKNTGTKVYTFTVADNGAYIYFSEYVDPDSGEILHKHSYDDNYTVAPTCTEAGYSVKICTGCQEIGELSDGSYDITYMKPDGHEYSNGRFVEDGIVEFTCIKCGGKLYAEIDPFEDQVFTNQNITPITNARVYELDELGNKRYWSDSTADWEYEYVDYNTNVTSAKIYGENNKDGGLAKVDVLVRADITFVGKYVIPYGTYKGQYVEGRMWQRRDTINPKGFEMTFNIIAATPTVVVTPPVEQYYATDEESQLFFQNIYTVASINNGTMILDSTHGTFVYSKTEDGEYSEYFKLEPGENTYYYIWVPVDNKSFNQVTGSFTYTALDYELLSISIDAVNRGEFIDEEGNDEVKKALSVIATYKVTDTEQKVQGLDDIDVFDVVIVDSQGNEYKQLRAGNYFIKVYYTYPYGSKDPNNTKSAITTSTYTFIALHEIDSISVELNQNAVIYDYVTLEGLRDYVTVTGTYKELKDPDDPTIDPEVPSSRYVVKTRQINASIISCADWGQGGDRDYVVNFIYNTNDTHHVELSDNLTVHVTTYQVEDMRVVWEQSETPTILVEDVTTIGNYGNFHVYAEYTGGVEKEIYLDSPTRNGYTITGSFANVGTTQLTITYSEANPITNIVTTKNATINVIVSDIQVSDIDFTMKEGKAFAYSNDNSQEKIASKINLYVTLSGTNERVLTKVENEDANADMYYEIRTTYYRTVEVDEEYVAGRALYIQFLIFSARTDGTLIFTKTYNVAIQNKRVVSITATNTTTEDIVEGVVSLDYFKENYLQINELYDDESTDTKLAGSDYIKQNVTLTLPAVQNGLFKEGDNTISITYITPTSDIVYTSLVVNVKPAVKLVSLIIEYNEEEYDANNDGRLDAGYIFTSSTLTMLKNMIKVKGYYSDGSDDYLEMSEYSIDGSLANVGYAVIDVTAQHATGEITSTFTVYVTEVAVASISAIVTQGSLVIYESNNADVLFDKVSILATNNDKSTKYITSGYTLSIVSNEGKFKVGTDNEIRITYLTHECIAEGTITVTKATLDSLSVSNNQGDTIIYQSSQLSIVKDSIIIIAHYVDNTTKVITASNYELTGVQSSRYEEGVYDSYVASYTEDDITRTVNITSPDNITVTPLTVLDIEIVSSIKATSSDTTGVAYYRSYGIDSIKNYIVVTGTYNDGVDRELLQSEYTLSGDITANSANTITLTHNSLTPTFVIFCENYSIKNISSVASKQNGAVIYTDVALNDLKQYLTVTVALYDTNPNQITGYQVIGDNDYTIQGTINVDGSYSLDLRANGVTYNVTTVPWRLNNSDTNKILTITPIIPESFVIDRTQLDDTQILTGTTFAKLATYLNVRVKFNNHASDVESIPVPYDEEGVNGYKLSTLTNSLISYSGTTPNNVTLTYTNNGTTITTNISVPVVANYVNGMEAEYTQNTTIYFSNIYNASSEISLSALNTIIRPELVVKRVWTDNSKEITTNYTLKSVSYKSGENVTYIENNGGYIVATLELNSNPDITCTIDVYVTKVEDVNLRIAQDGVIFSSYTLEHDLDKIKAALKVYKTRNDGTELELAGTSYDITITGSIALNTVVTVNAFYSESEEHLLTGTRNVTITKVVPTSISVDFNSGAKKIYTSTPKEDLYNYLTVNAEYNNEENRDLDSTEYTLTYTNNKLVSPNTTLNISYTLNGVTKNGSIQIDVDEVTITSIQIRAKDNFTIENQQVLIYDSYGINKIKDYIDVIAYSSDESEYGAVSPYTLTLKSGETWGAGTKHVIATYSVNGVQKNSQEFEVVITAYGLSSTQAILDKSNLVIYSDYVFEDIKSDLRSRITISGVWNDGYNHAQDYSSEILTITGVDGANAFDITYYYYNNKIANPTKTEYTAHLSIADVMVAVEVSGIAIKEKQTEYTIYASEDVTSAIRGLDLYLVYNSGREEETSFTTYTTYSFMANQDAWKLGGRVEVTAYVLYGALQYNAKTMISITPVVLQSIDVTYTQKSGVAGRVFESNTSKTVVLSAGNLVINGTNNDGNAADPISPTRDMISFDFTTAQEVDGQLIGVVTLTYLTFVETFNVVLTKVEVSSVVLELANAEAKVYTNTQISALANKLKVTAIYNDESTKLVSYDATGENGYTISGNNNLGDSAQAQQRTFTVTYKGEVSEPLTITIYPRDLVRIVATYNQNPDSKLFKISTIDDIIANPHMLIVNAKYQLDETQIEESVSRNNYEIKYIVGGEEVSEFPDGGEINLTVSYTYGTTTKTTTFSVLLTAKAQSGIEVAYTQNKTIYTTTLKDELTQQGATSDVEGNEVLAKGSVVITNLYNDGTTSIVDGATYSASTAAGKYTLTANFATSNVVTLTYNGFSDTFEVELTTPKLNAIEAEQVADTKIYTSDTLAQLKGKLSVSASYDDDHTINQPLTTAQYNLEYTSYVGSRNIIVVLDESLASDVDNTPTKELRVTFIQKIAVADVNLTYSEDGEEYKQIYGAGIKESKNASFVDVGYFLRYSFTAKDASNTVMYLDFTITNEKGTTINIEDDNRYILNVDKSSITNKEREEFTITATNVSSQSTSNSEYFEFVGTVRNTFVIFERKLTTMSFTFTPNEGETVYKTTSLKELVMSNVVNENTINAKGIINIYSEYNDGSNGSKDEGYEDWTITREIISETATSVTIKKLFTKDGEEDYFYTYTLSGNLMTSNEISITLEGKYARFTLQNVVTPEIELTFNVNDVKYGSTVTAIKAATSIATATYIDEHDTDAMPYLDAGVRAQIISNATFSFFSNSDRTTSIDIDKAFGTTYFTLNTTLNTVNVYYGNGSVNVINTDIKNVAITGFNGVYTAGAVEFVASKVYDIVNGEEDTIVYRIKVAEGDENEYTSTLSLVNVNVYTIEYKISAPRHNDYLGEFTVTITPQHITLVDVEDIDDQTYTGSAITPELTLTYNGYTLVLDEDYEVAYSYNVNDSTERSAIAAISGIGNFDQSVNKLFVILGKEMTNVSISGYQGVYDAEEHVPFVANSNVVTLIKADENVPTWSFSIDEEGELNEKTYSTSLKIKNVKEDANNLATDYTIYFKIEAKNHITYYGAFTAKIAKRSISEAQITAITPNPAVFTGVGLRPDLTIMYKGERIVADVDYIAEYSDNVDVGEASATAYGRGNFTGDISGNFNIVAYNLSTADASDVYCTARAEYTADNPQANLPNVTVRGVTLEYPYVSSDVRVSVISRNGVNISTFTGDIGIYVLRVQGISTNYTGSMDIYYEITKKTITDSMISNYRGTYVYNNKVPAFSDLTIKDGNVTLTKDVDYQVAGDTNVNAGDNYTLTITGKGNYTSYTTTTYAITKIATNIEYTIDYDITKYEYTGHAISYAFPTTIDGYPYNMADATVRYYKNSVSEENLVAAPIEAGNYSYILDVDNNNFSGTVNGSFTISKKSIANIDASAKANTAVGSNGNWIFTGSQIKPGVVFDTEDFTEVTYATPTYKNNINVGEATITVRGNGNFTGEKRVTFNINALNLANAQVEMYVDEEYHDTASVAFAHSTSVMPQIVVNRAKTLSYPYTDTNYQVNLYKETNADDVLVDLSTFNGAVGDYKIIVTGKSSNVTGTADTLYLSITSDGLEIDVTMVQAGYTGNYTFTGAHPTFSDLVLKDNDYTLVKGLDYEISVGAETFTAGSGKTVTITGIGSYSGEFTKEYSIGCATDFVDYDATKLAVTMTPGVTYTYNGTAQAPQYNVTYDGVVLSDEKSISYYKDEAHTQVAQGGAKDAGVYYFVVLVGGTNILSTELNGSFEILKASVTLKANDVTTTYGTAIADDSVEKGFTVTPANGNYNNEIVPTYKSTATATSPVGEYVVSLQVPTAVANNYNVELQTGVHTITKKAITLAITAKNVQAKAGDAFTPGYTVTSEGFVGEDKAVTITPTYTYEGTGETTYAASTTAPTANGTYSISVSATATAANYDITNITYTAGALTISEDAPTPPAGPTLLSLKEDSPYKFRNVVVGKLKNTYTDSLTHDTYDSANPTILFVTNNSVMPINILQCFDLDNYDNIEVYDYKNKIIAASKYSNKLTVLGTGARIKLLDNGVVVDEIVISVLGDVSGDGKVNATDTNQLYTKIKNKTTGDFSAWEICAADFNKDGKVNATDTNQLYTKIKNKTI